MPHRPLTGNWFEEEAYERDRARLIQGRHGNLIDARSEVARIAAKMAHHNTPTEIAKIAADGFLRFYRPLMLQNACTLGYLSIDLDDRAETTTGWRVSCSTAPASEATRRSAFVLIPAATPLVGSFPIPPGEEEVVHYGQPFYLTTVPTLCEEPLSLASEFATNGSASKVSGKHQAVYFSPDGGSAGCMWYAVHADPDYVEDARDLPVRAGDVIMIQHNMTNAPLASTKAVFYNDFGTQNEVCAGRILRYASKRGAGPIEDENFWMFIHRGQGAPDGEAIPAPTHVENENTTPSSVINNANITATTTTTRSQGKADRKITWEGLESEMK
ncbi:unnamed protein product [Phytomonas sp. EM1]|nr:unnamed protein product [Phytomonas sp. EM1]|eukprot:CCW62849.1 unnamed protein product [Phytomonas sp. isolate EM1]